uniref:DUF2806 domain-containing protein n=1 Tax=Brucella pseudintermedia TaxID=370111 RepID=UPI00158D1F69|nr:DUF2806 domain-containing protein [Brucella pseudintermedia]
MEKEDHLSNEVSISAEMTENGVKASAKSRFLSALDRLCGNIAEIGNAHLEGFASRRRAKTEGEVTLIKETAQYGVHKLEHDSVFAERAFNNQYQKTLRLQANKDAVVQGALQDLRNSPVSEEDDNAGPHELNDEFLNRFERYAEDASTEELQQRWSKVLAGEIRKPGTFNRKVLRAVDELEPETAILFQRVAQFSLGGVLPICLTGKLTFDEQAALISSGLMLDPGLGHWRLYNKLMAGSTEHWLCNLGEYAIAFPVVTEGVTTSDDEDSALGKHGESFAFPVYALTDVGKVVGSIIPDQKFSAFSQYVDKLAKHVPAASLIPYRMDREANMWIKMGTPDYFAKWPNTSPQPG